jgi:sensor histidine kinase YesM
MNQLFEHISLFHQRHRVITHLLFWLVIYGLGVFATSENQPLLTFEQNIMLHLMMMVSKIPIAYWLVYGSIPLFFDRKQHLLAIFLFLGVYYLNFCLSVFFKISVYPYFQMYVVNGIEEFSVEPFLKDYFLSNLGAAAALVLIKLLLDRTQVQIRSLTLEKQKSEIELKLLKTQLNPHFLFNTLNNIYTLSLLNSPKTSESIARLSEILDYILYRCNAKTVPISGEIQLIEHYIALEKLRYDERLKVSFTKEISQNVEIAPLILLTFVENAFKHGASEDAGSPEITIDLRVTVDELIFMVKNSLSSMQTHTKQEGLGLLNIQQQLELIYPKQHLLEIKHLDNLFEVILTIKTPSLGAERL